MVDVKLEVRDLREPYDAVFDACRGEVGEEGALRVVEALGKYFGGQQVYFYKFDALMRAATHRAIREEFNGGNHKALARKFNMAEQTIRVIVSKGESD